MKHKLQTLLKHKLQWLLLLAALLGVSQGVWGYTVYFDNTNTNWSNVYIYFYKSNYWNDNGSGSQNIASGPNAMTHVSGNIWSYENNGNYTRVAFTKDNQSGYGNFHQTEAAYSDGTNFNVTGSLSSSTPLFTPSTTKTTKNSNVPYYSGAWSAYSSCTTPTISAVTPSSAQTKSLPTGSATPSVAQAVSATYTGGNQKGWTVTPSTISGYSAATFDNAARASTNLNMKYEGEYTATFGAGCGNTSDATRTTAKITVNPSEIYLAGPLLDGSGVWATNHKMTKSGSTFTYEWTAARTSGQFTLRTSTSADQAGYIIPNYAKNNYTGITAANSGNHNLSVSGVSFAVGERVKVTATYVGWNSTEGKPEYNISFTKVCSNPTAQTVSGTATICDGSSTNVTVSSSQSNYTYKLYKDGSATATTQTGSTGSALNFSVSEAGAYTVHAYYTSGSDDYCKADMTGSATVTVTPTASIGSVTLSSSSGCIGQGLSATANSVELGGGIGAWSSSNTSIATVSSTGTITPKAAGSANITYTITDGCGGTVSKYATLTVKPNAAAAQYTLTNNTQTYNGAPRAVTVTPASGAGTATIYYTGTGGTSYAKSTTAPINAGTYAITVDAASGTNYCAATNLSVGTLTVNKANQSTLTISNTATDLVYCDAANVKLTTSGGSGDGAVTYTVTSGSGDVDGDVLSPSAKGSVSVTATKAASQNFNATTSAAKTFNFNKTAPTVYTLSNLGDATTICGDPSSGAGSGTLRLANSQTGYKYQLYSNGAPIEGYAAKAGTDGSSIDFPVTSSGTYTVYAYYGDNSTNCPTRMDGEITLTISTQPRLVRSAASVTQYMPVTITSVSTDIAEWKITDNTGTPDLSSSTAYLYDKTYDAISFKGASTNGSTAKTYTIQATTAGGCSEKTTVTVNPDTESCGG